MQALPSSILLLGSLKPSLGSDSSYDGDQNHLKHQDLSKQIMHL